MWCIESSWWMQKTTYLLHRLLGVLSPENRAKAQICELDFDAPAEEVTPVEVPIQEPVPVQDHLELVEDNGPLGGLSPNGGAPRELPSGWAIYSRDRKAS